ESLDDQGLVVQVVNRQGQEIFKSTPRIRHKLIRDEGWYSVRIYDLPWNIWRPLFVLKDGSINVFECRKQALDAISIYEAWAKKKTLLQDEIDSLVKYVWSNGSSAYFGSRVLVRVDETEPPIYAGFRLSPDCIAQSDLQMLPGNFENPA